MGDGIGQFDEAPLIEEKHESSMRLPSLPVASSASQVLLAARARIGRFPPWGRHSERRDDGRIAVRSSRLPHTRYCSLRASSCRSCIYLRGVFVHPCLRGASVLSTPVVSRSSMHSFVHNPHALDQQPPINPTLTCTGHASERAPGRQQHLARRGRRGRAGQPHRRLVLLLDQRRLVQLTDPIAHVAELLLRSPDRVNAAFDSIRWPAAAR